MTPLDQAHAEVKAEIARCDSKASLLLALDGVALTGMWSVLAAERPPVAVMAAAALAAVALLAAVVLLLLAVRPRLGGRHGFPLWSTLTPDEIRTALGGDLAADIAGLSRLAVAKMRRLQRAVDLTLGALGLLAVGALIAAGGAL